tara:strand:- start:43 stop:171 length:129 start_codon:yes stop_codon:yes gene_type:complete
MAQQQLELGKTPLFRNVSYLFISFYHMTECFINLMLLLIEYY